MKHILVYGSLRAQGADGQPEGNFGRCGEQTYISTHKLRGFELYSFSYYPGILHGSGQITVELHQVDEKTFGYIDGMEKSANYHAETVEIAGIQATLYVYNNESIRERCPRVLSGDWSKRNETNLVPA